VDIKYDSLRGGWCSKRSGASYDMGVWKCIKREWEGFFKHVRYEAGEGSKVQYWLMFGVESSL
jgi:hypothetical protein